MSPDDTPADPMPLPPEPPDLNDCCGNGCDPCIFDAHDLALDAHRQALRAWHARQAERTEPTRGEAQDNKP